MTVYRLKCFQLLNRYGSPSQKKLTKCPSKVKTILGEGPTSLARENMNPRIFFYIFLFLELNLKFEYQLPTSTPFT